VEGRKSLLFLKKKKQKDFYPFAPKRCRLARMPMDGRFSVLVLEKNRFLSSGALPDRAESPGRKICVPNRESGAEADRLSGRLRLRRRARIS
jgi:hypothetical protein